MKTKLHAIIFISFTMLFGIDAAKLSVPSLPVENIWIGNSNDWNDAANWSLNFVPDFSGYAVINEITTPQVYPVISTNANYLQNCLIADNATLSILAEGELIINDDLINNGSIDLQFINEDFANLIVRGDVIGEGTYQSSYQFDEKLYYYYGMIHAGLTFADVSNQNSALRMKQYINNEEGYSNLTSEYAFDSPAKGYLLGKMNTDPLIFKGEIYQDGFIYNLQEEYNLLCNPFPGAIDVNALLEGNAHLIANECINNSIITFEKPDNHHKLQTHYLDAPVLGSHVVNGTIKPGETFLIRANKQGLFMIDESFCKPKSELSTYDFTDEENKQYIRLKLINSETDDDVVLVLDENGDQNAHTAIDCYKMPFFTDLNKAHIALYVNEQEHQIKFINFESGTLEIPLRLHLVNGINKTAVEADISTSFPDDITVELIDTESQVNFDLRTGQYAFDAVKGNSYRFKIRFYKEDTSTTIPNTKKNNVIIYVDNNIIKVYNLPDGDDYYYQIYDTNGRLIKNGQLINKTIPIKPNTGYIICKITRNDFFIKKTLLIQ